MVHAAHITTVQEAATAQHNIDNSKRQFEHRQSQSLFQRHRHVKTFLSLHQ
jgi:hypothetical protein